MCWYIKKRLHYEIMPTDQSTARFHHFFAYDLRDPWDPKMKKMKITAATLIQAKITDPM